MNFSFINLFPFHLAANLYPHPSFHVLVFLFPFSLLISEIDRDKDGERERESPISFTCLFINDIYRNDRGLREARDREIGIDR